MFEYFTANYVWNIAVNLALEAGARQRDRRDVPSAARDRVAGMLVPSLILWATGALAPEHRGKGMGFWSAAFFLGQFTSPLFVNLVRAQSGGVLAVFAAMGGVALVGAVLALLVSLVAAGRRRRLENAAA